MNRFAKFLLLITVMLTIGSCNNVGFKSESSKAAGAESCTGPSCPDGGDGTGAAYGWVESGFGLCTKPCGGGNRTQFVECQRKIDKVVVGDSLCTATKPVAAKSCNIAACTAPNGWNWGDYGACSKTCGGGVQTRVAVCQDQNGNSTDESQCTTTKPATSMTCGNDPCDANVAPKWSVTNATCPLTCANSSSSVTDTAVCKKNDGQTVADSFCPTPKPAATHACNQDVCPQTYTYQWAPGPFSDCSVACGGGLQTRSASCLRNDGAYVVATLCAGSPKPATQQTCNNAACPAGTRDVTQTATVTPASNSVDVILIVDDSSSMKEDQSKLAQRLSGFIGDLDALNIDYQVCLTTTDVGYYKGSPIKWEGLNSFIMTKNSPNKNSVFLTTIDKLGAEYSSDEQSIKATYFMTRDFRSAGCMRPQAALTTIVISDEDERSVGGNQALSKAQYQPLTAENMPDNLINFIHQTFDTPTFKKPFTWNSIIVKPGDSACEAAEDAGASPSFPGTLLADLSIKTGGAIGSICDNDYTQNLKIIKERVVNNLPGMTLECAPIGSPNLTFTPNVTTSVSISGQELKFTPALPEGTQITAKYKCAI